MFATGPYFTMTPPPLVPLTKENDVEEKTNQELFIECHNDLLNNPMKSNAAPVVKVNGWPSIIPAVKDKITKTVVISEHIVHQEDVESYESIFASNHLIKK